MKKALLTLWVGLVVLSLSACMRATGPNKANSMSGLGKTLTVWLVDTTNPDADSFLENLKNVFKDQTGAELNVKFVPRADLKTKLSAAQAAGDGPDVAELDFALTPALAQSGDLLDISERAKTDDVNLDFVETLTATATFDNKLYALPWYATTRAFLYNKKVFQQAGITTVPTSWDDLAQAVTKIGASQPDVDPWPLASDSPADLYPFIWGGGGNIATQQGGTWLSELNSPASVAAIDWYARMAQQSQALTGSAQETLLGLQSGKIGMAVQSSATPATLPGLAIELRDTIGAFVIPSKDGGIASSTLSGSNLAVLADSTNQDLAWQCVKLMTTTPLAGQWMDSANELPANKALLDARIKPQQATLERVFVRQMVEAGQTVPLTPEWSNVPDQQIVTTLLNAVISGQQDAQSAADRAASKMNTALHGR